MPEGSQPKKVDVQDPTPSVPNPNPNPLTPAAASGIVWTPPPLTDTVDGLRIWRDSTDTLRISFRNTGQFARVGFVPVPPPGYAYSSSAILANSVMKPVAVTYDYVTVAFTRSELQAVYYSPT